MVVNVSVIIPVYNAERYLDSCIESLLSQALNACEFIFINDGSTDNSRQVIEEYKKLDHRIKLINQTNQGVSKARNNGLKIAFGEYIGFIDADDYIDSDMYKILYSSATQSDCDVVMSNLESEIEGYKVITRYPFPINTTLRRDFIQKEIIPYFLKADNLNSACNKIYRNKVIKHNNILFPEKVTVGEDGMFNMLFVSYINSVKYIDYTGYHYQDVKGSATRNIAANDYFEKSLEVYKLDLPEKLFDVLSKNKTEQLKSLKLVKSVMSYIHVYFKPTNDLSFSKRYKYIKDMINNKYVRESLPIYYKENYSQSDKYEKMILTMINRKSVVGLYCATIYSRLRNK